MFNTIKRLFSKNQGLSKLNQVGLAKERAAKSGLTEKELAGKNAVLKGEKMVALVNNRGIRNLSLSELTEAKRIILVGMQNFTKEAPTYGGNWARSQETLRRIEEERRNLLKNMIQRKAS